MTQPTDGLSILDEVVAAMRELREEEPSTQVVRVYLRPDTWTALARDKKAAEQQGWLPGQITAFGIPVEIDPALPTGRYELRVRRRL